MRKKDGSVSSNACVCVFFSGYYCKQNVSSISPDDGITGGPCRQGKYCPAGSVEGENCPNGVINILFKLLLYYIQ